MPDLTANYGLIKPSDNETADITVINQNMDTIDGQVKQNENVIAAHLAESVHIPYAIGAGAVNTYIVTLDHAPTAYSEGMAVAVKINLDNTGASTINVNGLGVKSIKKPNGNDVSAGNLKAGSIYTFRYNGVNFILQGEGGGGTAQSGEVLTGKTYTNDSGEQAGTMPNQGQKIFTPGTTNVAIPAGYHNGTGYVAGDTDLISTNIKSGANIFGVAGNANVVDTSTGTVVAGDILAGKIGFVDGVQLTGTMTNRGAYNITPTASNITIPAGYHNGAGVVYGDSDLVAGNILSGKNIFGVIGTLVEGKQHASGSIYLTENQNATINCVFQPVFVFVGFRWYTSWVIACRGTLGCNAYISPGSEWGPGSGNPNLTITSTGFTFTANDAHYDALEAMYYWEAWK